MKNVRNFAMSSTTWFWGRLLPWHYFQKHSKSWECHDQIDISWQHHVCQIIYSSIHPNYLTIDDAYWPAFHRYFFQGYPNRSPSKLNDCKVITSYPNYWCFQKNNLTWERVTLLNCCSHRHMSWYCCVWRRGFESGRQLRLIENWLTWLCLLIVRGSRY